MAEKNYTIDGLRLIGAFCVVTLHSPLGALPNGLALGFRLGSRWAVPFFFLVSGYFIAKGLKPGQELNTSKSISRLGAVLLIADLIYASFFALDGDSSTAPSLTFIRLLVGQSGHLWYLGATIFGLILLQYFASRYSDVVLLLVAIGTFGLILAGDGYSRLTGLSLQYEVARYLTAIPFLFGGFLLARHGATWRPVAAWGWLLLTLVGLALETTEAVVLYKRTGMGPHNQELLVGTALVALGIFQFGLTLDRALSQQLAQWGRQFALPIYLYHALIINLLYTGLHIGSYSQWLLYFSPLISFSVTLLLLVLLQRFTSRIFQVLTGG